MTTLQPTTTESVFLRLGRRILRKPTPKTFLLSLLLDAALMAVSYAITGHVMF